MTIAFICVFIAVLMPYLWMAICKWPLFASRQYNNHTPRLLVDALQGASQRANWAQMNSYEALPGFIAAVVIASLAGAPQDTVDMLAVTFIVARFIYGFCYILDKDILRSLVWGIGFASMIGIFIAAF